jgi:hypothetical protein
LPRTTVYISSQEGTGGIFLLGDVINMFVRRAARFVIGDYSRESGVTSMLKELKWPTLQQRRTNTKMVVMYRIVKNNCLYFFSRRHRWHFPSW